MKRSRSRSDQDTTEEASAAAPAPPERKSSLLRECWADLRGRPRPVAPPKWEDEEVRTVAEGGGVGLDEEGMRRLRNRYERSMQ